MSSNVRSRPICRLLRFALLLVVPLGVAGACGGPLAPEGITFMVSDTTVAAGDTIQLILTNTSAHPLGFNLCLGALERRDDDGWSSVQRYPDYWACPGVMRTLTPGDSATYPQQIFSFIEAGIYRFRDTVEWPLGGGDVPIVSERFRVVGPP